MPFRNNPPLCLVSPNSNKKAMGARMKRTWVVLAATAVVLGCSSKPLPPDKPQFDSLPHAPYLAQGTSVIRGQVLLREKGDAPIPCSDTPMIATPATTYFRQVIRLAAMGQMPLVGDDIDPDYRSIVHIARCDAGGNFAFDGLPPGDWFVVATVNWAVRSAPEGSLLYYRLRLKKDETIQIVMTDRNVGLP
jgi:hypothetical protein